MQTPHKIAFSMLVALVFFLAHLISLKDEEIKDQYKLISVLERIETVQDDTINIQRKLLCEYATRYCLFYSESEEAK